MARDYAAEYARRTAPGRVIRSGAAKGAIIGSVPRQIARGHRVVERPAPATPLPRIGRRASAKDRAEHAALVTRRRAQRHVGALRRAVESGEHAVWGPIDKWPGVAAPEGIFRQYPATPAGLRRLTRQIASLPADTLVQIAGFGDLREGYNVDWRGSHNQWRTIGTGQAGGPVAGIGGAVIYPAWDVPSLAFGTLDAPGPFETVRILELRVYNAVEF
jgi:hypothetical protein